MTKLNIQRFRFRFLLADRDEWLVALNTVTMGDIIDNYMEFEFGDGTTLPMTDVDWGRDKVEYEIEEP